MYIDKTIADLVPGDEAVVNDGNYQHAAGQLVVVCDKSTASEFWPPTGDTRVPVCVPESGRLLLLVPSTPVLVEG